jgi:hypothetical protein
MWASRGTREGGGGSVSCPRHMLGPFPFKSLSSQDSLIIIIFDAVLFQPLPVSVNKHTAVRYAAPYEVQATDCVRPVIVIEPYERQYGATSVPTAIASKHSRVC